MNRAGEKLAGIQILEAAGLQIPRTLQVGEVSIDFPELGASTLIFRPSLDIPFRAEYVERHSGNLDSVVIRRNEWGEMRSEIVRLRRKTPLICQPYLAYELGAIAHLWAQEKVMRIAFAAKLEQLARGDNPIVEGYLNLDSGSFQSHSRHLALPLVEFIADLHSLGSKIGALSAFPSLEIEMCRTRAGEIWFLQAQPSSELRSDSRRTKAGVLA